MKKILLFIFLLASMSFAALIVEGNTGDYFAGEYSPRFWLTNNGKDDIKGFKVHIYFYVLTCSHCDDPAISGEYDITDYDLAGGKVSIKRVRYYLYKMTIDYPNTKIPANSRFPSKGKFLTFNAYSYGIGPNSNGVPFENFVVESSGKRLFGKHPDDLKKKTIGALTTNEQSGHVYLTLDVEDHKNKTGIVSGNENPRGVSFPKGKVTFTYWTYDWDELPRVPFDYAVLRLDVECPKGSYPFGRHHDTEDSNNRNSAKGEIWPNVINKNADLKYCFVPADKNSDLNYPFDTWHGVYANYSSSKVAHTEIIIDDEDSDNKNSWDIPENTPEDIKKGMKRIMNGGSNTTYHVVQWIGRDWEMMAKSSSVGETPVFSESQLVAAVPMAPAIKGFNRSAVTVELKSAGRVVVSVMNIRGDVIATVSQDNMQPGIHMVNWNSGAVPNGRYVVAVKQNGKFSAKNVILK